MNLIGMKIRHTVFGTGEVTEQHGNYISVQFADKTSKFVYPDAFDKFITAEDAETQALIVQKIQKIKTETQHQRHATESAYKAPEEQRITAIITSSKAKNLRSIDEMFSEDYHVENLARQPILSYQQVEQQFGIKISGFGRGINPTKTTVVLISSIGKSSGKFVYHDKWTSDGDYIYSGEGKTGNQTMTRGNLAIRNATRDGKEIHLFVKFSPQDYYYQGIFTLLDCTYEDEKDENGNIRKEYKFRLRKVVGK